MMLKQLGAAVVVALALVACAIPNTPQQTVYAAKATYVGAAETALRYMNLPRCAAPAVQPCSSQAVVDGIKKADNIAFAALEQAEAVVRTPGFGESAVTSAVAAAQGAVRAFVEIVPQISK